MEEEKETSGSFEDFSAVVLNSGPFERVLAVAGAEQASFSN